MLKLHKCRLLLSCPFYNVTKFDQSRQMRIDIILRFRLSLSQGAVKRWDARHLQLNGHKKKLLLFTVVFFKLSNTIFQNTLSANATLVLSSLSYFRI